jgi:glycosyltransferase involved in cell wall biosynthesis
MVVSTHYHPADRTEPEHKRLLLRLQDHVFGMTAYRTAAALIVETQNEKRQLAEFAPTDKVRIVPPGIHAGRWDHPEADQVPAGLPESYVLFAGRLATNKGLPGLFEALATIPTARRPPLVVLGKDWGVKPYLLKLAEDRGITDRISWVSHQDDEAGYRGAFRHAKVFVLPSEYEAFGIVLLEALVAGVPAIATAVGGTPEVLDHGRLGQLVPYGDAHALGAAIEKAWAHPDPAQIAAGRVWARKFDWSAAVDGHRAVFHEVVDAWAAR